MVEREYVLKPVSVNFGSALGFGVSVCSDESSVGVLSRASEFGVLFVRFGCASPL